MIIKGNNHAPFKVNKGTKGYNVWVYKTSSETHPDGVIRHHYKMLTTHGKYHSREDATAVAWHYIENHSYAHSDERHEFAKTKLIAHRGYMEGYRKTTPFLHPDTWQDDNEGNLTNMK